MKTSFQFSPPLTQNASITFKGTGNVLICDEDTLVDGSITFESDDALLYLCKSSKPVRVSLTLWRSSTVYIGENNYFNGRLNAVVSERRALIIGNDSLFSFGIWIRTADPHLIYSCSTGKRINPSDDILIGDHVWIGQDAKILKGVRFGSGSILGAGAIASGKFYSSNCSYGGIPAKLLSEGVFFKSDSVHNYTPKQTQNSMIESTQQKYIYSAKPGQAEPIELLLSSIHDAPITKRASILKNVQMNKSHNRFAIYNRLSKPLTSSISPLNQITKVIKRWFSSGRGH